MRFSDPSFQERLREALNADEEFALESRWFDGSILLESGAERCWLKVYRGQVIDHLEFVPAFGYTFKLTGVGGGLADARATASGRSPTSRHRAHATATRSRRSRRAAAGTGPRSWRSRATASRRAACTSRSCGSQPS